MLLIAQCLFGISVRNGTASFPIVEERRYPGDRHAGPPKTWQIRTGREVVYLNLAIWFLFQPLWPLLRIGIDMEFKKELCWKVQVMLRSHNCGLPKASLGLSPLRFALVHSKGWNVEVLRMHGIYSFLAWACRSVIFHDVLLLPYLCVPLYNPAATGGICSCSPSQKMGVAIEASDPRRSFPGCMEAKNIRNGWYGSPACQCLLCHQRDSNQSAVAREEDRRANDPILLSS